MHQIDDEITFSPYKIRGIDGIYYSSIWNVNIYAYCKKTFIAYIYIYIYLIPIYIYIYIYTHTHTYIYIYIYIYKAKSADGGNEDSLGFFSSISM